MRVHFLTHPEVDIDPEVPVTEWGLSDVGRSRAELIAPVLADVAVIHTSPEAKADQAARLIAAAGSIPVRTVAGLAEIDRSATGYLPEPKFWANYQEFLARPTVSAAGWETAVAAQQRICDAVAGLLSAAEHAAGGQRPVAIMSHGGVGALLLARLTGRPIERLADQPGQGSHFSFDIASLEGPDGLGAAELLTGWSTFEDVAHARMS